MADKELTAAEFATIQHLAQMHLGLDTLETQKSDRLDFKEQAVWSVRDALVEAFLAGKAAARDPMRDGVA